MRVWLILLLLVSGCKAASSGDGGDTTTTTALPATTTSVAQPPTTSATSFEVPAVIDLPYVQRVLKTIYHLDGEAARHVYAKKVPDAELNERLEALFGGPRLAEAERVLGQNAADGFVRFANPPGDAEVRAVEIIQATGTCMIIRADLDYGPQYSESRPPEPQAIIQMTRADVLPFNPTGWGIVGAGVPVAKGQNLRTCP